MSVLAPTADFESEDSFLHAVLGLVAGSAVAGTWLATTEGEARPPAANDLDEAATPGRPVPVDDVILHALLGLARLTALATGVASAWATVDATATGARDPLENTGDRRVEGLLR